MKFPGAILVVLVAALAACKDAPPSAPSNTAVLGGFGSGPKSSAQGQLTDAAGQPIPAPAAPRGTQPKVVRAGADAPLALWLQDGNVVSSTYAAGTGWSAPQPLEDIHGEASDPQLAADGRGSAMAIWRHTVGNIQSLRYSRFDASGWSVPDVMPGALPRPRQGADAAPQLHMDEQGRAFAEWPSGFNEQESQSATYVPGQGWGRAQSAPLASAGRPPSIVQ